MGTFMTVEYDYKLEVNTSSAEGGKLFKTKKPLEEALLDIDSEIIDTIQNRIPNGNVTKGKRLSGVKINEKKLPDVKYNSINSRFINMCYTESDVCKWVKSKIKLSFLGDAPESLMERMTLQQVQKYLEEDVSDVNSHITATFAYPMIHSSIVQFELSPVVDRLGDSEIQDVVKSFYNVYHAIVNALDGDTDVSQVFFVDQDILDGNTLMLNLQYYGKCRYCTETEFMTLVDRQIQSFMDVFLDHLKANGNSTFFEPIQDIAFSLPESVETNPPIDWEEVFDGEEEVEVLVVSKTSIPWWMYVAVGSALLVILIGALVICTDQRQLHKEEAKAEASTGNESDSYHGNRHESDDDEENGANSVNAVKENCANSVNANGMHTDYEVYVY